MLVDEGVINKDIFEYNQEKYFVYDNVCLDNFKWKNVHLKGDFEKSTFRNCDVSECDLSGNGFKNVSYIMLKWTG